MHPPPPFDPALLSTLRDARRILVVTGAGVSAESGVPTFRGSSGVQPALWEGFDPMQLATPEAFARHPEIVARWYDERRALRLTTKPNAGHHALVELERRVTSAGGEFLLATQNVDRLHHAAGSRNVEELHGSIMVWRCTRCEEEREELGPPFEEHPPRCHCGGARRPGVVWFGEAMPEAALNAAMEAAHTCDLFLSVGTSSIVFPAAGLIEIARAHGARTLEVNAEETPISRRVDWSLRGKSGEILPGLLSATSG